MINIIQFLMLAIATVGLAVFYQKIQRQGMILYWWRRFFEQHITNVRNVFLRSFISFFAPAIKLTLTSRKSSLDYPFDVLVNGTWYDVYWLLLTYYFNTLLAYSKNKPSVYPLIYPLRVIGYFVIAIWLAIMGIAAMGLILGVSLIGTILLTILKWLKKPLVTCIHCNVFWLSALLYWLVYGIDWHFLMFFGITYLFLYYVDDRFMISHTPNA